MSTQRVPTMSALIVIDSERPSVLIPEDAASVSALVGATSTPQGTTVTLRIVVCTWNRCTCSSSSRDQMTANQRAALITPATSSSVGLMNLVYIGPPCGPFVRCRTCKVPVRPAAYRQVNDDSISLIFFVS